MRPPGSLGALTQEGEDMTATQIPRLVDPRTIERLDVLGPIVEILTPPDSDDEAPCVLRGTIPPGVAVPLHSHPEPETFVTLTGEVEGLARPDGRTTWTRIGPGDVFHVPGGAQHAFRSSSHDPTTMIIVTTASIARFFREVGTPVGVEPPPLEEVLERFLAASRRYGYWNATPQENAAVGVQLSF
jgi:quercetin dioxygenase-like cupin family protein